MHFGPLVRARGSGEGTMTANDFDLKLRGLSRAEARHRLAEHGPNALPEAETISLWRRRLSQFKSALIYILLFALALDLAFWAHAA